VESGVDPAPSFLVGIVLGMVGVGPVGGCLAGVGPVGGCWGGGVGWWLLDPV